MFGAHLSIAGGLVNALHEARRLRMDCVQVFTRNQRQWRTSPLRAEELAEWHEQLRAMDWHRRRGPVRVVSHNSYLINLASPNRAMWERSIAAQRAELERCEALGIRLCVAHPGAHLGAVRSRDDPNALNGTISTDERAGLVRIARALDQIHRGLPGYRVITCLEATAGSGTNLGYDFHHLATIRDAVAEPQRVGFCMDTCHLVVAGYDMSTEQRARAVLREFDSVCGLRNLRVIHINDSAAPPGSRLDRHAHIGRGTCGLACFRTIVNRRSLAGVPKILETPKGLDDAGRPWDVVNMRRLKRLIRRPARSR